MSHLHLSLLGTPEVYHAGRLLKFRTRKELALLIYLAVEGSRHSREKITTLLWPESNEPQGRTTLRRTLADLRSTLADTAGPSHLIVERDSRGFNFDSDADLDLSMTERALGVSRTSSALQTVKDDSRHHPLSELERAAHLYRGHFLEGFSLDDAPDFDDWVRLQREVWYRRMDLIFDRLPQRQSDARELSSAIETITRWIAHNPLNEVAHRRLMHVYVATGDRNAALRAYETYRLRLAEELDTRPAEEIKALAMSIRAQATASAVSADSRERISTPSRLATFPDSRKSGALTSPLVGRTSEYVKLIEGYQMAQAGQTQVVILNGEAGIGKTRLADEFLAWAAFQGADILSERAFNERHSSSSSTIFSGRMPLLWMCCTMLGDAGQKVGCQCFCFSTFVWRLWRRRQGWPNGSLTWSAI